LILPVPHAHNKHRKQVDMSSEVKTLTGVGVADQDTLEMIAGLYCRGYNCGPWYLDSQKEEILHSLKRELAPSDITVPVVAYYKENGMVLAYTSGLIGGLAQIAHINETLMVAPYFGDLLPESGKPDLGIFWNKVIPMIKDGKFLYVYDTLRDPERDDVIQQWFETASAVSGYALEQEATHFVGFTLEETQIYKMLVKLGIVTYSQITNPKPNSKIRPILLFSNRLGKVDQIFRLAARMAG